jgi:proteasome lid subunit RPN8/RPN11
MDTMKKVVQDERMVSETARLVLFPPSRSGTLVLQEAFSVFQTLLSSAGRAVTELNRWLVGGQRARSLWRVEPPIPPRPYRPLKHVILTDGVGRVLFEEYRAHQESNRGEEETGWLLIGVRDEDEALVLATFPAGAEYDAGIAHIRFNSCGQALASRIVRQADKRLNILGIVHTHPGSLRHPSDGDFRGDSQWVRHLRGKEGVFAIGTADGSPDESIAIASLPKPHVQCWGGLRLTWYALRESDPAYRPLPVHLTLGPDLARPLHGVWSVIEKHAERLDRLCRQQTGVRFELISSAHGPALIVRVSLAVPNSEVKIILREKEEHYYVTREGRTLEVKPEDDRVDRALYLVLADLAGQES